MYVCFRDDIGFSISTAHAPCYLVPVGAVPGEERGEVVGRVVGGGLFTVTRKVFLNVAGPPVGLSTSTSAV